MHANLERLGHHGVQSKWTMKVRPYGIVSRPWLIVGNNAIGLDRCGCRFGVLKATVDDMLSPRQNALPVSIVPTLLTLSGLACILLLKGSAGWQRVIRPRLRGLKVGECAMIGNVAAHRFMKQRAIRFQSTLNIHHRRERFIIHRDTFYRIFRTIT